MGNGDGSGGSSNNTQGNGDGSGGDEDSSGTQGNGDGSGGDYGTDTSDELIAYAISQCIKK